MYTLVMMTALTTAPESTQFNGFFRDLAGGSGCQSDARSQSDGTNCRGSNGCNGCCGGGGLFNGRIISFFSFGGGCRGSSCNGSCDGRSAGTSCQGSSCQGNSCNGSRREAASCFGSSCFGNAFAPMNIPTYPGGGYDTVPFSPPTSVPSERDTYRPTVIDERERGVIIVRLPDDAKLFAEGRQLTLKSDQRRFVTPPLPSDRDAVYNLRVEYTRDGEVISRTKRVQIRAGESKTVEFHDQTAQSPTVNIPELFADKPLLGSPMNPSIPAIPSITTPELPKGTPTINKPLPLPPLGGGSVTVVPPPQALSDRAKITVKIPDGATLFVDAKKNSRTDAVREFTTPALKKGELYTYQLRIEWSRNGQQESEERKVQFMAGEMHTVDFTLGSQRASR